MNDVPIHSQVRANLHPDSIRGDSQGAKSARLALGTLYTAAGKIHDLHDVVKGRALIHQKQIMAAMPKSADGKPKQAPPLMYDSNAASHVIEVGTPLATAALKAADVAITSLGETVERLDSAIHQKVTAGKNPTRGPELRAWASKQEHPFQNLGSLFQKANENSTLIAEIVGAEPYLSNLSAENQQHLKTVAAAVLAPDEVQARAETSKALGQLEAATKSFTESTGAIFNGLRSPTAGAINAIVKEGDDNG